MTLPTELSDRDLTELVGRTLRTKAASVTAPSAAHPFTRTLRRPELHEAPPAASPRRRWWLLPAAAAVLVLVVGCAATLTLARDDGDDVGVAATSGPGQEVPAATPDAPLLPGWVPDDLAPVGASWRNGEDEPGLGRSQLFLGEGGAGILVEIAPGRPGVIPPGDPVTVRGVAGSAQHHEGQPTERGELRWQEDATVTATYENLSQADALAFLDSLSWRSDDHQAGFAAPSEGALSLVGENAGPTSSGVVVDLTYDGPGGRRLTLRTVSVTGQPSLPYLLDWLLTGRNPDETVGSFEPDFGSIHVQWPDGHMVSLRGDGLSEEEMRRVYAGLAPAGPDARQALLDRLAAGRAELPLVADATLPSGTVQLREAARERTVCLRLGDAGPVCPTVDYEAEWLESSDSVVADLSVDGTWYVVAVSSEPLTVGGILPDGVTSPGPSAPVAVETAFDGTYHYLLARPDPSLAGVTVMPLDFGSGPRGELLALPRPGGVDTD